MFESNISREELCKLPLAGYEGKIVLINERDALNHYIPEICESSVLGFDTETKPVFRKHITHSVALLQLASGTSVYLIRLNRTGIPSSLVGLLEDEKILKVGAAIRDDIRKLRSCRSFVPGGFVDIQKFVKQFGIEAEGLRKITAIVLKFRISKSQQLSNWEDNKLTPAQQRYAATDAWVCREIYGKVSTIVSNPESISRSTK
ncbi:MAG: 3'-5' exonuclease domain-containing protein 2 [Bacteroidetes bacterium]|nr:3'-5' exonuclease domain-containing protein 2 [Bacteroidota bacterium]